MEGNFRESIEFKADKIDLGILINRLREYNKLTVRELSAKSGVSYVKISEIENAKLAPNFYTISRLCRAMGHSVSGAYAAIEAANFTLDEDA
jgi:transcriptional regulator with XRE-family HTH domain